jgi:hypothetical protein
LAADREGKSRSLKSFRTCGIKLRLGVSFRVQAWSRLAAALA